MVTIIAIGLQDASEMMFIQHDHMIQTLSPDRADHALSVSVMPW